MRALVFQAAFVVWSTVLCLACLPLLPFLDGAGVRRCARLWEGGIIALLRLICGIRLDVQGTLPTTPVLLAARHQSALETLVFHRLVPDVAILIKAELVSVPLLGTYLLRSGCIPVERDTGARALRLMVAAARERLADGLSLLVFPEGTRVPPGERRPYRPGVAALYLQLGQPVVPVALHTGHVWGPGLFGKRPGVAVIEFLEPIPPGLDRRTFMDRLETRIATASDALAAAQRRSSGRGPTP